MNNIFQKEVVTLGLEHDIEYDSSPSINDDECVNISYDSSHLIVGRPGIMNTFYFT